MTPRTRRGLLRAGGVALGGLLAGCNADVFGGDEDEFPPPAPTSAAPSEPQSMPTGTAWPRFGADAGNTGHRPGVTAVPDDPTVYWSFFTQATPPVVEDGTLYTVETNGGTSLVARDAATGRVEWTAETEFGGALGVPAVAGDRLVVQSFTRLLTFDRETGDPEWNRAVGSGQPGSPVVVDGAVYLANDSFDGDPAVVFACDLATGEERWTHELGSSEHLRGSVAVADRSVFVGAGDLVALDVDDGTERWRTPFADPVETTPTVDDGTVYVTDARGTCHAVSTADGTEQWTASVGEPARGTAAAVADGAVYVGTTTGLHAISNAGERRWQVDLTDAVTPSVDTESVYVGENGFENRAIVAVNRADGTERWRRNTAERQVSDTIQAGVRGPPTTVEGGLYVVAADGIRAFGR